MADAGAFELSEKIATRNSETMKGLVRQLRSPLGVIPFIGAGMSATVRLLGSNSRFPQWRQLIVDIVAGRSYAKAVMDLLDADDFESAASLIESKLPNALNDSIENAFNKIVDPLDLRKGPLSYLPSLSKGPVITTNYDRVLEQVFLAGGKEFVPVINGPRPYEIVSAIHTNCRALIKMHGDCQDRLHRVFTRESYEKAYGTAETGNLRGLAWLMFTNRPLLFLGCSLNQDRTVGVLREIAQMVPGIRHYAILAADKSEEAWESREKMLDQLGVRALWYAPGDYQSIEFLLQEALVLSSTTNLVVPETNRAAGIRLLGPAKSLDEVTAMLSSAPTSAMPAEASAHIKVIANEIRKGRLIFFLGAYAGLDQSLLGSEFYARLAEEFDYPSSWPGDRTDVAGHILSQPGAERLWEAMREEFGKRGSKPSAIHHLIAALPSLWRSANIDETICVLTTNYDTLMEEALYEAGEPFRLLYYVDRGRQGRPCFLERLPNGVVRQIDDPLSQRASSRGEHLVVKLNGGLSYFRDIEEQAAMERGAFERLAAQLPDLLPIYLREKLQSRPMLFLGHGLAEPDVRRVIKLYAKVDNKSWSWAVQLYPNDRDADLFTNQGLKIIKGDLTAFTAELVDDLKKKFFQTGSVR